MVVGAGRGPLVRASLQVATFLMKLLNSLKILTNVLVLK